MLAVSMGDLIPSVGIYPGVKEKPTKALPIPRAYEIRRTIHAERRAFSPRKIPLEMIDDTIRTGRAYFEGEKGRLNGDIFKFTKSFIVVDGANRRTKSVVAVCEIVGKVCHVITTYNE